MAADLTPEITAEIRRVLERFGVAQDELDLTDSTSCPWDRAIPAKALTTVR